MKMPKHSITFFSFFPVAVLLATPLMFSTFVPASTDDYYSASIDSSDWVVPQSQLVLEKVLKAGDARNGEIEEVRFLDYGDSIYGGGENASSLISSSPAILNSGEVETAYILQNPEFQRQVEDLSQEAEKAGATMPPLLTLVALFAFAMATGSATLKEFFKFSTYTEQVKKTVQVTKKVARTVYRKVTEKVARTVKAVKQVAYTAYETVKNVAYNTRTWVTEVVRHKPQNQFDMMKGTARLMNENFANHYGKFSNSFKRNARYYLPVDLTQYDRLKAETDKINSGKIAPRSRYAEQVWRDVSNSRRTLDSVTGYFFEGIEDVKLKEKLTKELKEIQLPTYVEKVTHSETTPVVTYTQKAYTAYRDEVETKTVYDTVTREVPETIYEDVTEDREITEDITKHSFTPLNEKIDLAMGYLKNYSQTLKTPSNRNFSDDVLVPNRDLPLFAGAYETYRNLGVSLRDANIYNYDKTNPEVLKEILRRHNEFIYSMKSILTKIQKGQTPQEQMTILFGKSYADSVGEAEKQIAQMEDEEKEIRERFEEIYEMAKTGKISTRHFNTLYNTAKDRRDQLSRQKRDAIKYLDKTKKEYSHRFDQTVAGLKNLAFLRNLDDWRKTLEYGERTVASRLVPFTTANGSTVYRRANAVATTQAQPKKTISQPADLQTANATNSKYLETLLKIANERSMKAQPEQTIPQPAPANLTTANAENSKYLDAFMRVPNNLPAKPKDSLPPSQSIAKKEAQFALKHPEIARRIGVYDRNNPKLNISSTAVNFMINSELPLDINEVTLNKEKRLGSESNAIRHVIWQALVTKEFGIRIAKEAGDAHEANSNANLSQRTFTDIDKADETVDLLNNVIGRSIGNNNKESTNVEIALLALQKFKENGLWTVKKNSDGTYTVQRTKITESQYKTAYNGMQTCNEYGYDPNGKQWKELQLKLKTEYYRLRKTIPNIV